MPSGERGTRCTTKKWKKAPVAPSKGLEFVPLAPEKMPRGRPRYRDSANPFNTWSGRGKRPDWLRKYLAEGRELSEFEIRDQD